MLSPFVKGLMCATLLNLGVSSLSVLIQGPSRHAHIALFWYVPGLLALPLAFLLFTHSLAIARAAFGFLLFTALLNIASLIWATIDAKSAPPVPTSSCLFYAIIYAFPCVAAMLIARRGVHHNV